MKQLLKRMIYRLGYVNHKSEFLFLFSWVLFFPGKSGHAYFLGFAAIMGLLLLRNIYFMKNLGVSTFSYLLAGFNGILVMGMFWAYNPYQSILFFADIFLISCYFTLFYLDRRTDADYFRLLSYIISLFSLLNLLLYLVSRWVPGFGRKQVFFISSIHEGIISGIAALILLFYLLNRWDRRLALLLAVNLMGVFVSESKAAYLGTVFFALVMVVNQKRKLIPFVLGFILLTFLVPNPIRSMFHHSLTRDPYALNRLDIWGMSLNIFQDHWLTGVGPDNFSVVSGRYNFKQTRGPANYFKVPHRPHNDYLKLLTESGVTGLLIIMALLYLLVRKMISSSLFDISGILLLYILFQAFLFNILFNVFFFFIFLFLLKTVFEGKVTFKSFGTRFKLLWGCLVVTVMLTGYLFPWLSDRWTGQSRDAGDAATAVRLVEKAAHVNPLDPGIYYLSAFYAYHQFMVSRDLGQFYLAVRDLHRAQRLNPYFIDTYLLEAQLYLGLLQRGIKYRAQDEEIMEPLDRALTHAPVDPFLRMTRARVYLEFDKRDRAREEALAALALEPEFVDALYFLQRHFDHFPDEADFNHRIAGIREKARALNPAEGHYLYRLYRVPEKQKLNRKN